MDDVEKFKEIVVYYKCLGCLIVIDDFGVGYLNFEWIWNFFLDIVKLDCILFICVMEDGKVW